MEHEDLMDKGIISVKEARKLLGAPYGDWSDETTMGVIYGMVNLSEALLAWQNGSTNQGRDI